MTAVGIDFGTTNCSLAYWTERPQVLPLGLDRPSDWAFSGFEKLFPSVFAVEDEQRLFGWAAKVARSGNLQAVKRLLAENEHMKLGGRTYSCRHVAALIFAAVRDGAQQDGLEVRSAVVTVPSGCTGQARFRTKQAASMAGIKVTALINEPTAAALAYSHYYPDTERLLVFDWGGGTIDVTVLVYENGIYQEKASHGVAGLGGIELDLALERALSDVVRADEFRGAELANFKLEIERTKIRLSDVDADEEVPFLTPDGREVAVTRRAFEQEARHYVLGTLQPLQRCLEDTNFEGDDFDAVLMVGGSCLLPYVRAQLTEYLQTEPVADVIVNPLTVVAEGAALAAAALQGERDVAFSVISNHDLGTRTKDDSGRELFSRVIPRGVTLPYRASRRYKPNADFEPKLSVQVWEGDADKPLEDDDNVLLAELVMRPDKPRVRDDSIFELEYRYDIDAILHVSARHLASGRVLLDDEIDFYTEGAGDLEPEVSDIAGTFAAVDAQPAAAAPARPKHTATPWRERHHRGPVFVVDGSNVACVGRDIKGGDRPSYNQLQAALEALRNAYPGARLTVVVDANFRHRVAAEEKPALEQDLRDNRIFMPPAGWVGAGDTLVLDIAGRQGALVVSNDSYREFQERNPWVRHGRLLGAALIAGEWYFNMRKPPAQRAQEAVAGVAAPPRVVQDLSTARTPPRHDLPVGWESSHWWSGE